MRKSVYVVAGVVLLAAFFAVAGAPQAQAPATAPVTTVVTVLGPKFTAPPAISKDDIGVYEGKDKRDVTGWTPAQGEKALLQLAIVIDEACSSDLGNQLSDLKSFILAQPKTTAVGVFYASNGGVQAASPWNNDHDAAAKGLRLPLGNFGAYSSIYLSTMSLIKGWPEKAGVRREILLIADGIDRFRGDPFSPDVTSTYLAAEKAGVIIHTLYCSGVGRASHSSFRVNYGQSNLAQITDKSGGYSFFQGLQTPISFAPFLEQLDTILKNQYFLGWNAKRPAKGKGELRSYRIKTELRDLDISSSDQVWVPGAGAAE
jgi:hypothetical protein